METRSIKIFDTTLRDGEQSPGASMTIPQKISIAHSLHELGVDVIEAGFPIASPDDYRAVHRIAGEVRGPVIAALARARMADIERAGDAVSPAERSRIHTFIATSPIHREEKLMMSKQQVIDAATAAIERSKEFTDDVEFSPEDAGRTELEYLAEIVRHAIAAGAKIINIPDTVGYCQPDEYAAIIRYLKEHVPNISQAVISVHCHDDLGLATANTLAGIRAGAGQAECAINGIGERAGNASLEEVVMALRVRPDIYGADTNIVTPLIKGVSDQVAAVTWQPQRNKAVIGRNAFAHEAGIHQDGMMKDRRTYEIMRPEDVGADESDMVLGKHSSSKAVRERLVKKLNVPWNDAQLTALAERFKTFADSKAVNDKYVSDDELREHVYYPTIIEATGGPRVGNITQINTQGIKKVRIEDNRERVIRIGNAIDESEGAVNAAVQGMKEMIPSVEIANFRIEMEPASENGSAAPAVAHITLKNGSSVTARAKAKDTQEATLLAVQNAFNALWAQEEYARRLAETNT